ncbi:hypothetical protein Tco_0314214, partial [Tanacetum coccineum]
ELFKKLGVTLQLSIAYHPQIDGQTEYNTNYYTPINTTPVDVVYGQSPPTHVSYMAGDSHVEAVDRSLLAKEADISLLQFHLEMAQQRMKVFAIRSDKEFLVGDWVC